MPRHREGERSVAELVLLSLLAEQPMHGYQANAELERRQVRDWAAISRPQVYYTLEKLAKEGLLASAPDREPLAGPERVVYRTTARGKTALRKALAQSNWATRRDRPAFLTWLALSWQADKSTVGEQLQRRIVFVTTELAREQETLASVRSEVGHEHHEAIWMLKLVIEQFRTELRWLHDVDRELAKRAPARHPGLVSG